MRHWVGLAAVVVLSAGCVGGISHHATLSASEALAQARADGFVRPAQATQPPTYLCAERRFELGPSTTGRYAGFRRPTYQLEFDDSRVHTGPGNVGRILMLVTVFPDAATAGRCAEAGIYLDMHPEGTSRSARMSRRMLDPTTIVVDEHSPGRPGDSFRDDTGQYDTFIAQGRAFAQGLAYSEPHSKIVREDLERLVAEIAG
jgi:hypothetical protein